MKLFHYDAYGNVQLMYDPIRTDRLVSAKYGEERMKELVNQIQKLIESTPSGYSVTLDSGDYLYWDNTLVLHHACHVNPLHTQRVIHRVLTKKSILG